jgi:hypothetical protein
VVRSLQLLDLAMSEETRDRLVRSWGFGTVLLAALGLILGGAHVLEMPAKMAYDAELYAAVTSTLYQLFGPVGALLQVASILAAGVLAFLVRGRPAFRPTLLGAAALGLSLLLWFSLVAPVNAAWREVMESAPEAVPEAYERLRPRWEYGHVAAFAAWLSGFCLLLFSVLQPSDPRREVDDRAPAPARSGIARESPR